MLEGLDPNWHEVGSDQRYASYTTLPAGTYRFRVQGATIRGPWSEPGASVGITIKPAWWATWWFRTIFAVAALLTVLALYFLRVRQVAARVRARLEDRMGERERIARDLHDTLLQGVQGLMLRFQVAADRIPRGEPTREMLDRALERADQLLDEGRERVKALRAPMGAVPRLPQAVARIVEQLAPADASPFRITVEGAVREVDPIVREEVQLLAREALANAYHHANASQIEAEIAYADDALTVRIRDDGKGIDREFLREGRPGHFGLLGMRERAKKIRARLNIWSKVGAGTEVEIRVPAAIAYRQFARAARRRPWWRKTSAPYSEDPVP
jgi:signal transduction histidine kinase